MNRLNLWYARLVFRMNTEKRVATLRKLASLLRNDFTLMNALGRIEMIESKEDKQEKPLINHHVERLMENKCEPIAGVIFSDMVTDLERCADHAINIAYALKEHP